MTENIINLNSFNPFEDAEKQGSNLIIHLRIQKRNGRKSITIIEGLIDYLNTTKIMTSKELLKLFKKNLSCNGTIKDTVIQLSGDQRVLIKNYLIKEIKIDKDSIVIHG